MKTNCPICGKPKKETSKYCSDTCRKADYTRYVGESPSEAAERRLNKLKNRHE